MADPGPVTLAPVRGGQVRKAARAAAAPPGSPKPKSRKSPAVKRAAKKKTAAAAAARGPGQPRPAMSAVTVTALPRRNLKKKDSKASGMPAWNSGNVRPGVFTNDARVLLPSDTGTRVSSQQSESSKAQATRIRKEFADKTRHTHRMLYEEKKRLEKAALITKVELQSPPPPAELTASQFEAEGEFKKMMKEMAKQNSMVMAGYRKQAIECERLLSARNAGLVWRGKATNAKFLGPYKLPGKLADLAQMCRTGLTDPRSAAAMFLLVCLRRTKSRKLGNEMLLKVMHPDCLTFSSADDGNETTPATPDIIRKHTYKNLHNFVPEIVASYVVGTTAKNGYAFDPDAVRYEVDDGNTTKVYKNEHGATCNVWLVTTGAPVLHPASRMVELKNHHGKWHVRRFNKLTAEVQRTFHREIDVASPVDEDYVTPVNNSDTGFHRFREGGLGKARRKLAAEKYRLQEKTRTKRQVFARVETQGLATMLVNRDLYDKYIENPSQPRQLVTADGKTRVFDDAVISRLKADHEKVTAQDVGGKAYVPQDGDEDFVDPGAVPAPAPTAALPEKPQTAESLAAQEHEARATSTVGKRLLTEAAGSFTAMLGEAPAAAAEPPPADRGSTTTNDLAVENLGSAADEQRGKAFPEPTAKPVA